MISAPIASPLTATGGRDASTGSPRKRIFPSAAVNNAASTVAAVPIATSRKPSVLTPRNAPIRLARKQPTETPHTHCGEKTGSSVSASETRTCTAP